MIASVGNYSGFLGATEAPIAAGLAVWVQNVNDHGGLFGHLVRLVVADDGGDPNKYTALVKQLVEQDHVVAFVENAAPATINAGDQYLSSVGVPVIGTACANAIDDTSPVIFPQCPTLAGAYYGAVHDGVVYSGGTRLSVLYCLELPSCADGNTTVLNNGIAAQAGATITYDARVSVAEPAYTCEDAKQPPPTLLLAIGDSGFVARIAQSCGSAFTYLAGPDAAVYTTKDQLGGHTLLVAMPTFPFTGSSTPAQAAFQQAMKAYYNKPPGPGEAMGWTAGEEFQLAVTRAAQTAHLLSPSTLINALHSFANETLGGLAVGLSFGAGHATPASCWFPMQASGGNWSALNGGQLVCR